ncbi:hypothetical protein E0H54_09510 [Rhizobium leguminosarum bv. viciae]|nr:hypothetical protein E0H54_09510 [Rhizobium leguminosarum bv. viciae]
MYYSAARLQTRKGRCNSLNLRIVLSENRFRFWGRCASARRLPRRLPRSAPYRRRSARNGGRSRGSGRG